jgi:hypothetical protein
VRRKAGRAAAVTAILRAQIAPGGIRKLRLSVRLRTGAASVRRVYRQRLAGELAPSFDTEARRAQRYSTEVPERMEGSGAQAPPTPSLPGDLQAAMDRRSEIPRTRARRRGRLSWREGVRAIQGGPRGCASAPSAGHTRCSPAPSAPHRSPRDGAVVRPPRSLASAPAEPFLGADLLLTQNSQLREASVLSASPWVNSRVAGSNARRRLVPVATRTRSDPFHEDTAGILKLDVPPM